MSDKKQHGGRRAGAGRPPQGEQPMSRKVSVMLTPEQAEYLAQVGGGNISEGIRRLVAAALAAQQPEE